MREDVGRLWKESWGKVDAGFWEIRGKIYIKKRDGKSLAQELNC